MTQAQQPTPGKVIPLPRTRRLSLSAMLLEASHQIVLALWIGALVAVSGLAVPSLLEAVPDPVEASRASLSLLARISFLGCGAGGFLLLTTLLMHLLELRTLRSTWMQAGLLLVMTLAATALQVFLAPEMERILRLTSDLFRAGSHPEELERFRTLLGVYLGTLLAQALFGVTLLLTGVRRWYTYSIARGSGPEPFWP